MQLFSPPAPVSQERKIAHSGHVWANPMPEALAEEIQDLAPNDTGLPRPQASAEAAAVDDWIRDGAWSFCRSCKMINLRHLKEDQLQQPPKPATAKCRHCSGPNKPWIPTIHDVPRQLRGLTNGMTQALRPLELDQGPYERGEFGYRIHSALSRLHWASSSVEDKIAELPTKKEKKKAQKALDFLKNSEASEYRTFYEKHEAFLRRHPNPGAAELRRPLQWIEQPGIECALWPDLYFNADLCETVERATDIRRLQRQNLVGAAAQPAGARSLLDDVGSDGEDRPAEDENLGRNSVKRSFLRKVFGPITDYGSQYDLLHFMYDLSLWSDIGAKKAELTHMPMRLALKGQPWTPAFWMARHAALLDLQRQCGPPVLFKTWAPYEWASPYHPWVLDMMEKEGRSRLHLAGPETFHHVHILTELFREWVHGGATKGRGASTWARPRLHHRDPAESSPVTNFAGRIEFQDGKRKLPTQSYHGREAPHLHGLTFATNVADLPLETQLCATDPGEGHFLRGYVLDGQTGRTGSGQTVHPGPSEFSADGKLRLHHTETDFDMGIRAYDTEVNVSNSS